MIKLKYAIIGTLIPVFMVAHYSNKIIDNLWDEINVLKQNDREMEAMDKQIKQEIDDGIIQNPMAQVNEEKK